MVVVHLPPDTRNVIAELLSPKCRIRVREAEDKEPLESGTAYVAPADYHLLVEHDGSLSLSSEEPVRFSRPSIDVLFETAADAFGSALIGIVLTGANDDGSRGLKAVIDAGGIGLVQSPETAHVATMPRAALAMCPTARAMTIPEITAYLCEVAVPA
jgi:two-component system chemotaxis response regulator CheB